MKGLKQWVVGGLFILASCGELLGQVAAPDPRGAVANSPLFRTGNRAEKKDPPPLSPRPHEAARPVTVRDPQKVSTSNYRPAKPPGKPNGKKSNTEKKKKQKQRQKSVCEKGYHAKGKDCIFCIDGYVWSKGLKTCVKPRATKYKKPARLVKRQNAGPGTNPATAPNPTPGAGASSAENPRYHHYGSAQESTERIRNLQVPYRMTPTQDSSIPTPNGWLSQYMPGHNWISTPGSYPTHTPGTKHHHHTPRHHPTHTPGTEHHHHHHHRYHHATHTPGPEHHHRHHHATHTPHHYATHTPGTVHHHHRYHHATHTPGPNYHHHHHHHHATHTPRHHPTHTPGTDHHHHHRYHHATHTPGSDYHHHHRHHHATQTPRHYATHTPEAHFTPTPTPK